MLSISNLTVSYGSLTILNNLSIDVKPQQWLMVVGPNGAGKSTLVSAIAQGVPYSGKILIDGQDVAHMKPKTAARLFGVLTQKHAVGYSFSVEEIVRLGRYAFTRGMFSGNSEEDERKIEDALHMTGMESFRKQSALTLSGGELQRAFLAQLLAQDPNLLILDEPTNHLDLVYQKQIFSLINDWLKGPDRAVISVVHDLNLAKAYGTHAVLLDHGRGVSSGEIGEVLTPKNLDAVYSMDVCGWMRGLLSQWPEEDGL